MYLYSYIPTCLDLKKKIQCLYRKVHCNSVTNMPRKPVMSAFTNSIISLSHPPLLYLSIAPLPLPLPGIT